MLMRAITNGLIPVNSDSISTISHCLNCRSCEAICPSQVKYGQIINLFYQNTHYKDFSGHAISTLMSYAKSPEMFSPIIAMARVAHKTGLDKMAGRIGATSQQTAHMETFLPRLQQTHTLKQRSTTKNSIGDVLLFKGCMGQILDNETLHNAVKLLMLLGYNVSLTSKQSCCGALHRHQGDLDTSEQMLDEIDKIISENRYTAVVATSSACIAHLNEHLSKRHQLETPLVDIVEFLANQQWKDLNFNSDKIVIACHEPCSNRNVLNNRQALIKLLNQFPCFETHTLPANSHCCGAGGVQMLANPEQTAQLREPRINQIKMLKPDFIISQNLSCTLNLISGLKEKGIDIKVIHPVSLIMNKVLV